MTIFRKLSRILLGVLSFFLFGCEFDSDKANFHEIEKLPEEIGLYINLANINPEELIYISGPVTLYYQTMSEIGAVEAVAFTINGQRREVYESSGYLSIVPEEADAGKITELELEVLTKASDGSLAGEAAGQYYSGKISYKLKYIRITADDFEIKELEVDRVVFGLKEGLEFPFQLVIDEKVIENPYHIEYFRNDFPRGITKTIYILPLDASIEELYSYNYIYFTIEDRSLEFVPVMWQHHKYSKNLNNNQLYVSSLSSSDIHIYNQNLEFLNKINLGKENYHLLFTETGLVVCSNNREITVYSDDSFSKILSTYPKFYFFDVNKNDQLIEFDNYYQVHVYNLHSGKKLYTIDDLASLSIRNMAASVHGNYLSVQSSESSYMYSLSETSASLLYTFPKTANQACFHPVNKDHLILININSFEIMDVKTREIVFSCEGEFQDVDPISGNLLYYSENYSYQNENFDNIIIDSSYRKIYTLVNNTQSNGPFTLFNNHLIKSISYIDISPKLSNH